MKILFLAFIAVLGVLTELLVGQLGISVAFFSCVVIYTFYTYSIGVALFIAVLGGMVMDMILGHAFCWLMSLCLLELGITASLRAWVARTDTLTLLPTGAVIGVIRPLLVLGLMSWYGETMPSLIIVACLAFFSMLFTAVWLPCSVWIFDSLAFSLGLDGFLTEQKSRLKVHAESGKQSSSRSGDAEKSL